LNRSKSMKKGVFSRVFLWIFGYIDDPFFNVFLWIFGI
jgi:hypothetical protein